MTQGWDLATSVELPVMTLAPDGLFRRKFGDCTKPGYKKHPAEPAAKKPPFSFKWTARKGSGWALFAGAGRLSTKPDGAPDAV